MALKNTESTSLKRTRQRPPGKKTADQIKHIIPDYKNMGLSLRYARFAAEYISNGFNASRAYWDAVDRSCTQATACSHGNTYLQRPDVRTVIARWMERWLGAKKERLEKDIIEVLWTQAFYDVLDFINSDGSLRCPLSELTKEQRWCIEDIHTTDGRNRIKKTYEKGDLLTHEDIPTERVHVKLVDRKQALDKLAIYVQMFKSADMNANVNFVMSKDTEMSLASIFSPLQAMYANNRPLNKKKNGLAIAPALPEIPKLAAPVN